ncbi:SCO3242 family prenyltransferase [Nocardioides sp. zg-DK7169]|uniref:SCO3242 family prenyltransferase n=1 Tax=Nocardioides sp. zg-DK7169 TaxID=2736600 RepID=UPI001551807B|nr:UbiA family prenyltransferase [Nocardioides sp. zg-DK7169]NPC96199.1 UbiA family prenyltransferase [Nocardioides sp. zg-DK7169]
MTALPGARDLAELVRLPAVLTVPGDAWSGAAWSGVAAGSGGALMPLGSALLYWSGMALNDWADREVDAVERPERVIPSGRIPASTALAVAGALGAAGLAATAVVGGPRALRVSVPLALLVATYDVVVKDSPVGPLAMASTRGLDVLLGAVAGPGHGPGAAAAPAVSVAVHTVGVTLLSRGEVHGTRPAAVLAALASTASAAALLVGATLRDPAAGGNDRRAALVLAAAYAAVVAGAQARALTDPGAARVRAATGAGMGGLTLLQSAWLAARGRTVAAVAVAGAGPLLRRAARAVSPT